MRFVDLWQMPSQKIYLLFQASVLETFDMYRQNSRAATEAGGILLGHVRGEHLEVIQATQPQAGDVRHRMRYERNDPGHQTKADLMWKQSDGEIRYLGEWHTHPEDRPSPSSVDMNGWRHRALARQDGRATLSVIVGRVGLYVSLVDREGETNVFIECQSS